MEEGKMPAKEIIELYRLLLKKKGKVVNQHRFNGVIYISVVLPEDVKDMEKANVRQSRRIALKPDSWMEDLLGG